MNLEIANKLQKLTKDRGLSQEELAEKLGISRQAVSKWERAESSPDTDNLIALANLYSISLDELLLIDKENVKKRKININYNIGFNFKGIIGLITILLIIAYFCVGFIFGIWHPTWIGFLLIPFVDSIVNTIVKKDIEEFEFFILVIAAYLVLGFEFNFWHPGWLIFLLIVVYDCLLSIFIKKKKSDL